MNNIALIPDDTADGKLELDWCSQKMKKIVGLPFAPLVRGSMTVKFPLYMFLESTWTCFSIFSVLGLRNLSFFTFIVNKLLHYNTQGV